MRRFPPLNAIRAFEAAARHVSFTRAAAELHVTHGAVSRQVALLERWLGVALFQRLSSQLVLTGEGRTFLAEISPALDRIALSATRMIQQPKPVTIVINAPPTFTMRWLIPRLSAFQRGHSRLEVRLTTSIDPVDFATERYDLAIRGVRRPPYRKLDYRAFLAEHILPVCNPDLLEKSPLRRPADLNRHTLVRYTTEPYSWNEWQQSVGLGALKPAGYLNFEQMYFALQAALEGLGLALIPFFLVADDIAAGRLCTPFGNLGVRTRQYYALYPQTRIVNQAIDEFCDWLEQEGAETMKLCRSLLKG
jgi:LysR family glycine cleavage system transcriptional activator